MQDGDTPQLELQTPVLDCATVSLSKVKGPRKKTQKTSNANSFFTSDFLDLLVFLLLLL